MSDANERIRRRAYQIWLEEGRPEGRETVHWDMASELVAIEDSQTMATKPVRRKLGDLAVAAGGQVYPATKGVKKAAAVMRSSGGKKASACKRGRPAPKPRGKS